MNTREIVTGKYINPSTYVLYREDGSVFKTIKEDEPFRIGNQMRLFYPIRVPKKNGRGTILMATKFTNDGGTLEEFPLPHNKKGLWALTSGAARRGVFHTYREPQSALERQLASMSVSRHIIEKVDKIDLKLTVGGQGCSHQVHKWGFNYFSDGMSEEITPPPLVPMTHFNECHRGCLDGTYTERVYDAKYLVYFSIGTYMNGVVHYDPQRILLTPDADEAKVVEELKKLEPSSY